MFNIKLKINNLNNKTTLKKDKQYRPVWKCVIVSGSC